MTLGIDASNIKSGGGLLHLKEILKQGDPNRFGFKKVFIWGGNQLKQIESRPWLQKEMPIHLLKGGFVNESLWKLFHFEKEAKEKCDLIYAPGGTFFSNKVSYVSMSQNMLVFDKKERDRFFLSKDWIRLNILNYIQARSIKNAVGNIFISKYARQLISNQLEIQGNSSTVIYHGIDKGFNKKRREISPISSFNVLKPFKVLYVSIIEEYKHQWILVEAISRLAKQDKLPVELHLVGGYGENAKKKFDTAVSKFDPDKKLVKYYGKIPFKDLPTIYSNADLFAFSSSCENMPNILIEAICSKLPVISSNYGSMVEILGERGVFYDPTSVQSTYEVLKEAILDNKKRTNLCELSEELSDSFSWKECADRTFEYLSKCSQASTHKHKIEY